MLLGGKSQAFHLHAYLVIKKTLLRFDLAAWAQPTNMGPHKEQANCVNDSEQIQPTTASQRASGGGSFLCSLVVADM